MFYLLKLLIFDFNINFKSFINDLGLCHLTLWMFWINQLRRSGLLPLSQGLQGLQTWAWAKSKGLLWRWHILNPPRPFKGQQDTLTHTCWHQWQCSQQWQPSIWESRLSWFHLFSCPSLYHPSRIHLIGGSYKSGDNILASLLRR